MVCWGFGYAKIFSKNYVDGVGADTRKVIYKLLMRSYRYSKCVGFRRFSQLEVCVWS